MAHVVLTARFVLNDKQIHVYRVMGMDARRACMKLSQCLTYRESLTYTAYTLYR